MIIHPEKTDIPQIKKIWKVSFSDTDESINSYFEKCFSTDDCYISKDGDRVRACLQMMPCIVYNSGKEYKAKYMYAVCTEPEYRHRGIMTALINEACEREKAVGTKLILCVPSDEKLFDFYRRCGFTDGVYCSSFDIKREEFEKDTKPCEYYLNSDTKLFNENRNRLLFDKCFVGFTDRFVSLADGKEYSTAYNDNFYCMCCQEDETFHVCDCFFSDEKGKNDLFYFLKNETDVNQFRIDYCSDNNDKLTGVIRCLDNTGFDNTRIYLGFKME
ncbi:MAG: GNAT family N-acetyltransferase [Clostridia bacterium]|nr:GNAT family N-acetyltransferase [Clostridia bacterium]